MSLAYRKRKKKLQNEAMLEHALRPEGARMKKLSPHVLKARLERRSKNLRKYQRYGERRAKSDAKTRQICRDIAKRAFEGEDNG